MKLNLSFFVKVCLLRDLRYLRPECGACFPRRWILIDFIAFPIALDHDIPSRRTYSQINSFKHAKKEDVVKNRSRTFPLEGELRWVAGHKNRRAPNRCSYFTSASLHSDFFNPPSPILLLLVTLLIRSAIYIFLQLVKRSALLEELLPDLPHRLTLFQDLIPVKKNTSCPIFLAELLQFVPLDDTAEHILMLGYVASPTNGYPPVPGGHQAHSPGSALPYHQQVDTFVTDSTWSSDLKKFKGIILSQTLSQNNFSTKKFDAPFIRSPLLMLPNHFLLFLLR